MGDFLGTGRIAPQLRVFKPYQEAKKYGQSLKLNNQQQWRQHTKSKNFPKNIPKAPDEKYASEWESWGDFLGTGRVANQLKRFQSKKF